MNNGIFTPDPGATLPATYTYTAADAGVHQFSATLTIAGETAVLVNNNEGVRDVAVLAAPGNQLRLGNTPTTIAAGMNFGFTFQALDQFGNLAGGFGDTLHFTSTDPQAVLPANITGLNSASPMATLKTAGTQSITITDLSNPAIAPKTVTIAVTPAAVSLLAITMPASTVAGVAQPVTVTARDAFGNVVTNYTGTVHFNSPDSRNTVPADYTFTAGDAGTHTFGATMAAAGTQSLSVQDTVNFPGGMAFISVSPASATSFSVSGFPAATAGVAQSFAVIAHDAFGNVATGYVGTVAFSSSDLQAGLPPQYTFTASDGGIHTFSATLKTAGAQSVSVADGSNRAISGTQSGITVTPSTATHFGITGPTTTITTGKSFTAIVSALDAYGNVSPTYRGKVHFSDTVSAGLPSDYTFGATDNGVHSFSVTLNTAGTQTLGIRDNVNNLINGSIVLTATAPVSGGGGGGGGGTGGGGGGGGTSGKTV
jgi:hypothetical protein